MNILIFSWRGPNHPHAGGAEKSTHEHAKGWVRAGHNVTLFTSSFPGCKNEEIVDGVKIKRSGTQILGVHIKGFIWYVSMKHEEYDLVIDQFHGIPFFTPLFVREKKLAFIHEVTKEVWSLNPLPKPFNLVPTILGTLIEPFIFKLLYRNVPFMTVSESTKKDLITWGISEKNITVIHNGVDKILAKIKLAKNRKKTLIFLGALAKDKGVEEVLKVFKIINSKIGGYQFWIVGKGEKEYTKFLKARTKELGLEKNLKFWGFVTDTEKYKLLASSHLLINTSSREGWGLVVIEAASVGTPTVGYDVPGLRDSVVDGNTGLLSDKNPTSLAAKVLALLNNKRYEIYRKNCISWSKKFSWDQSASLSLKLIEKIVD